MTTLPAPNPSPTAPLEENLEHFRKESELLDKLVDDLFEQLEDLNGRLSQKSAELERQRNYIQEREEEFSQRRNESEDLREFLAHQNDQIAEALEKLSDFEGKLSSGGDPAAGEEIKNLINELKAEQEGMRQSRDEAEQRLRQESEQWNAHFERQGEQLAEALEKLSAFEGKLQEAAPAADGDVGEQLSGLLEQVQEQLGWLRERAESQPEASAEFDAAPLSEHLTRQDEQLSLALEKLDSFEEQLSGIAASDAAAAAPNVDFSELLEEIRGQREELRQYAEAEQTGREQNSQSLESFFSRHDEQFNQSLGKLTDFEAVVNGLSTVEPGEGTVDLSPQLTELIEQLRAERDEFRERFERASEEATRLSELVSGLINRNESVSPDDTQVGEALAASEQARQELDRDLAAANSRVGELEKTVARQADELRQEKEELRDQLRELRELLEMRSQWDAGGEKPQPAGAGSQTMAFNEEPQADSGDEGESVLAQFAKLSRKQ